ncbi:MAG: hypothetical protein ACWGQW_04535 [bacterium]
MTTEFNLATLLSTYDSLLGGEYKQALSEFLTHETADYEPPSIDIKEATIDEAATHVQNCAEYYFKVSKIAGYARSAQKIAEGQYKQAFRIALLNATGSNKEAREAEAAQQTGKQHEQLLFFESALTLFTSLEQAARVNADSSRKIADLIHSQRITESGLKYTP